MSRRHATLIAGALVFLYTCTVAGEPSSRFEERDGAFKLTLPEGWTLAPVPNRPGVFVGSTATGTGGAEVLMVTVSRALPGVTPQTEVAGRRDAILTRYRDASVLEEGPARLGDMDARKVVCEATDPEGRRLCASVYAAMAGERIYAVTFSAPPERFKELRPTLNLLLASFEAGPAKPEGDLLKSAERAFQVNLPRGWTGGPDPAAPRRYVAHPPAPDSVAVAVVIDVIQLSVNPSAKELLPSRRKMLAGRTTGLREVEREAPARLGTLEARRATFEYTDPRAGGARIRATMFAADSADWCFSIAYLAPVQAYARYVRDFEAMAAHFEHLDGMPPSRRGFSVIAVAGGDFEVWVPEHWEIRPDSVRRTPHFVFDPVTGDHVILGTYVLPPGTTLKEYTARGIAAVAKAVPDTELVDQGEATLGAPPGLPGWRVFTRFSRDGVQWQSTMYFMIVGGKGLAMSFTSKADRAREFEPTIAAMVKSFRANDPADAGKVVTFEDKAHKFRLSHPGHLRPTEKLEGQFFDLGVRGEGPWPHYRETISLGTVSLARMPEMTLERAAAGLANQLLVRVKGPHPSWEEVRIGVGGRVPAKRLEYRHSVRFADEDIPLRKAEYLFANDGWIYRFSVHADEGEFEQFMAVARKVLDSFEWTTSGGQDK